MLDCLLSSSWSWNVVVRSPDDVRSAIFSCFALIALAISLILVACFRKHVSLGEKQEISVPLI